MHEESAYGDLQQSADIQFPIIHASEMPLWITQI